MPVDYLEWLRWWRRRWRDEREAILLERWDPLGVRDDPEQPDAYARWAVRIGIRLRQGVSADEISEFLASANRQLGARVNACQMTATAMEIRRWYRPVSPRDGRPGGGRS